MIVTGNPLLVGVSGKMRNIVVKQYKDKTVITAVPDMSRRKLSQKQKDNNESAAGGFGVKTYSTN